jgi:hypothetical protein
VKQLSGVNWAGRFLEKEVHQTLPRFLLRSTASRRKRGNDIAAFIFFPFSTKNKRQLVMSLHQQSQRNGETRQPWFKACWTQGLVILTLNLG